MKTKQQRFDEWAEAVVEAAERDKMCNDTISTDVLFEIARTTTNQSLKNRASKLYRTKMHTGLYSVRFS